MTNPNFGAPMSDLISDPTDWREMKSAPKTGPCVDVLLKLKDGRVTQGHWAQDHSGEFQPIFDGWFEKQGDHFSEVFPVAWKPIAAPSVSSSAPPEKRPITSWERIPTEGEGPDDRAFWHLIEWARTENRRPDRGGIVLEDATIDAAVRCALELPVLRRELASLAKFAETDCARALHTVAHPEAEIRRLRAGDRA